MTVNLFQLFDKITVIFRTAYQNYINRKVLEKLKN